MRTRFHMPATYVGRSLKRLEDRRLLRGEAMFIDDLKIVGMLHVVFVRSVHAHARVRVDAGAALGTPGVIGVFCAADLERAGRAAEIPTVVDHEALRPCRQPNHGPRQGSLRG
jgi:aerobic carbon-monoxide dehydrogenase large subunit